MTSQPRMTHEQRQHHWQQWRESGMKKTQYARQHGINPKTFFTRCERFAQPQTETPALLPVTITPVAAVATHNITLTLNRASITGTVPAVAALIRELSLC